MTGARQLGEAVTADLRVEVAVVGAGPAGAAAAFDLSAAGIKVAILDRHAFPRDKPCAGALTTKAVRRLRFPIGAVATARQTAVEIRVRGVASRVIRAPGAVATMTVRRELDLLCLREAIGAGAIHLGEGVAKLEERDGDVILTTTGGRCISARFVIGADGASSRIRRLLGAPGSAHAIAIEGVVPAAAFPSFNGMLFDVAAVHGGYGWAFGKGDHVNVGLYSADSRFPLRKTDLEDYAFRAFGIGHVQGIVGHPLGIRATSRTLGTARVLLAGDAAGTAENLLGEGIHNAIASGQAAAAAIMDELDGVERASTAYLRLLAPLLSDLRTSARLARPFYALPRLGCAIMALPPVSRRLAEGFAAGRTLDGIVRGSAAVMRLERAQSPTPSFTTRRGARTPRVNQTGVETETTPMTDGAIVENAGAPRHEPAAWR